MSRRERTHNKYPVDLLPTCRASGSVVARLRLISGLTEPMRRSKPYRDGKFQKVCLRGPLNEWPQYELNHTKLPAVIFVP